MKLVVVESPNKCAKIAKYLGAGFEVLATAGHFRDLPKGELGVNLETFEPTYVLAPEKRGVVAKLKAAAARAEEVYLATDADREGEAISWHLACVLGLRRRAKRIRFTEITEKALKASVVSAGEIDGNLVDAQQARRVLDRLVGYQVSPLLRPFGSNHSAGRVQSATLHLVVRREHEREAFQKTPYWVLSARYGNGLVAKYATLDSKTGELVETRLATQEEAEQVAAKAQGPHSVVSVETRPVERRPKPPFTTSTLQQAASVQLGLKPDRTMQLAQALFEKGAITYHRSDSVALSEDAVRMARDFLAQDYPEALPKVPPSYQGKANAQEAHEAIRPTSVTQGFPADVVEEDERRLYALIRSRFLASQCRPAVLSQTTITLRSGETSWRARGAVVDFPSFLRYLAEDEDGEAKKGAPPEPRLPKVHEGEVLGLEGIDVEGKQTQPPPRFTQASLIREMERAGIGRPSTYAATVAVLFAREYVAEEKKFLFPTPRGRLIDALLGRAFESLLEAGYTAQMEERLDDIAGGTRRWREELRAWYGEFASQLERAPGVLGEELKARPELLALAPEAPRPTGKSCPRCRAELFLRHGKSGAFLACSAHPRCDYTADPSAKASRRPCPSCGKAMEELEGKFGRYARCTSRDCGGKVDLAPLAAEACPVCSAPMKSRGDWLSCSKYPACKGRWDVPALAKAKKAGKRCPKCQRLLAEKRGAKGKFLGCSGYPVCSHAEAR